MRVTFDAAPTETLEYLRTMSMVFKNNKEADDSIKAFKALKELVESIDNRLTSLEDERRNKVCR